MTKTIERRIVDAKIEVRTNPDGTTGVRGYAAVFDSPAHGEVIKRAAFNRTIAQKDNIRFLINHEGTPLASTRAGTMTVGVDDHGMWFDIPSLDMDNPKAQEFASATGRGDMYQCSFAGYFNDTPTVEGLREVREVSLIDVSGVTFPWYEDTSMSITGNRDVDRQLIESRGAPADLTAEQRASAVHALRIGPPGKVSWSDIEYALMDAIEESLGAWIYICHMGADWAVYRVLDQTEYVYGPYMQVAWKQNADGTFKLGTPFEVALEFNPVTTTTERDDDSRPRLTVAEARALLGTAAA